MAGERDLFFVGEVLVAKDQHGIFVHARLDHIDLASAKRLPAIDTQNLSGKDRAEWTDRYWHSLNLPILGNCSVSFRCRNAASQRRRRAAWPARCRSISAPI
jgi:hypothetical protein